MSQIDLFPSEPAAPPQPERWWVPYLDVVVQAGMPVIYSRYHNDWVPILFPVERPSGGAIHQWTGKGAPPLWARQWAAARGLSPHRDVIIPALRDEMMAVLGGAS